MYKVIITSALLLTSTVSSALEIIEVGHTDVYQKGFRVGRDTNGKPLYLCMARLFGNLHAGKTWPGYNYCNVGYHGKEYVIANYRLAPGKLYQESRWEHPGSRAVIINPGENPEFFLCQANYRGSLQPGKTWAGYKYCNISYGGREIQVRDYRILSNEHVNNTHYHHNNRPPRVIIER